MSSQPRGFGAQTPIVTRRVRQAMELHQSGQLAAAIEIYAAVLAEFPDHPDILHYLGMARYKQGDVDEARSLFARSIAIDGRRANVHVNLGRTFLNAREFVTATGHFDRALRLEPNHWEALHMQGRALLGLNRSEEALQCLTQALQRKADHPGVLLDLAYALGNTLRHPQAIEAFERILGVEPHHVEALGGIAYSLRALNRTATAAEYLRRAIALAPEECRWLCDLGAVEEELGNFEAAERLFRQALREKPNYPIALAHLLALRKGADEPALVTKAERHLDADNLQKPVRVQLGFALGKHFDSQRQYDRAFAHYRAANDLVSASHPYSPVVTERQIASLIDVFDTALFEKYRSLGNPSEQPLFIVGMPRSGTTLTEQILASHREIAGAGELGYFNYTAQELSRRRGAADDATYARHLDAETLERCAGRYLALLAQVSTAARRIVDKMPMNFLQVGLIALTFPNARIIHCRRDPLDTCLSCYFENFHEDQRYSTQLDSLAHFYLHYLKLMRHWRGVAPLRILEVVYEDVVGDVAAHAHRLIEFCGLDWDPNCLDFHRTARSVNTPSRWQVRQPIYRTSVQRWRNYEPHLGPLISALERSKTGASLAS